MPLFIIIIISSIFHILPLLCHYLYMFIISKLLNQSIWCALHIHILSLYNYWLICVFLFLLHRVTAACVSAHADIYTVFTLIVTLFGTDDHILSQSCSRSLRVLLRRQRGRIHPPFLTPPPAVIRHISNIWLNKQPEFIKHHQSPSQQRGEINDWILHYQKQMLYYCQNICACKIKQPTCVWNKCTSEKNLSCSDAWKITLEKCFLVLLKHFHAESLMIAVDPYSSVSTWRKLIKVNERADGDLSRLCALMIQMLTVSMPMALIWSVRFSQTDKNFLGSDRASTIAETKRSDSVKTCDETQWTCFHHVRVS